ncbi:hypothetical protein BpHYR1_046141 [Brachionus plicatilis]|uniref:Uncharacterized protein n=1 Tax=Brachionus plicatilis TaxID=10195 RepID=A0A3M7QR01_BRAPC|nr:hypothetical protein BpHYR1_046141 [Brachionus plicatilis]
MDTNFIALENSEQFDNPEKFIMGRKLMYKKTIKDNFGKHHNYLLKFKKSIAIWFRKKFCIANFRSQKNCCPVQFYSNYGTYLNI